MHSTIFNGNCLDLLTQLQTVPLIFADPPDNLGLEYGTYKDKRPPEQYYEWLELVVRKALRVTDCFWLSYYWQHDLEIKHFVRNIIKYYHPSVKAHTFIWRFTFGQYVESDCGSGFRYLLRLIKPGAKLNPDAIRIPSRRMELGDSRAAGPRVPDDVWEFPRVVGNSPERRSWHPTQHPEDLLRRIILLNSDRADTVVDLFGGTGTTLRVATALGRNSVISEINPDYCQKILGENPHAVLAQDPVTLI